MTLKNLSGAAVFLLWGMAGPIDEIRADEWVDQLLARKQPKQTVRPEGTQFSLSDTQSSTSEAKVIYGEEAQVLRLPDSPHSQTEVREYPSCVSHAPGKPGKPKMTRPGDINKKNSLSRRYGLQNCERAGYPHEVAWWADCALNKNYSAAFVGGGTPWLMPNRTRNRTQDEGTWGLDYDGIFKPRRVWLGWSSDREQGGLGSYETDGAPAIVERLEK